MTARSRPLARFTPIAAGERSLACTAVQDRRRRVARHDADRDLLAPVLLVARHDVRVEIDLLGLERGQPVDVERDHALDVAHRQQRQLDFAHPDLVRRHQELDRARAA